MWSRAILDPFQMVDTMRRAQGSVMQALGAGPDESSYEVAASGRLWTLRHYPGSASGPHVLIVPAPIKRPYIWDLAPSASVVRYCLEQGLQVHLLEWRAPTRGDSPSGLSDYADRAIAEAVDAMPRQLGASKPFLLGHSLGGTLAAIFAILHPDRLAGLVTLSTPLCLHAGASVFRDALAALAPAWLEETDIVPGSFLTQLSTMAAPMTFVWSRLLDAAATTADRRASDLRRHIERWALDEVPLSGKLVQDIFVMLYLENRLCEETLEFGGRTVGPSSLRVQTLAIANANDDVAPPATVRPFAEAAKNADVRLIDYPGESGVVLQHLGVLVGRDAHARIWPEIVSWMKTHR